MINPEWGCYNEFISQAAHAQFIARHVFFLRDEKRKEEMAEREEKRKAREDDEKENLKRKKLSPSKTQGKASLSLRKKAAALVVYRRRQWKYERISENQEIAVSKILTCEKDSFEVLPDTVKEVFPVSSISKQFKTAIKSPGSVQQLHYQRKLFSFTKFWQYASIYLTLSISISRLYVHVLSITQYFLNFNDLGTGLCFHE